MATSQSKMPPQQRDGLLDLFVEGVGFGGHGSLSGWAFEIGWAAGGGSVNRARRLSTPPAAGAVGRDGGVALPEPGRAAAAGRN